MRKYTYAEIAENFRLWQEYVDPSGIDTEENFNRLTVTEKMSFMENCFGREEEAQNPS